MDFSFGSWMLYTMWAVFGLMLINLLLGLVISFWKGSFSPNLILDYLKDFLYYVLPLNIMISMFSIDPTGWVLKVFYFIGGIGIVLKYLMDLIKHFK